MKGLTDGMFIACRSDAYKKLIEQKPSIKMSILLQEAKAELGLDVWGDPESEPGVDVLLILSV